ncbi:SMI1/KNR4 family protein [Clostridium estertheticum]|uniref:SMI1/KNR4 family protein n=1 Tax=Clostridium estertheticum TaxID=238834 RepID=A0AA47I8R5_9CLOT|nr:SMI1/KNR4 family protein [Clostridium estertheticum]MBU3157988.1 SMI1/KNR4 family protein [Clostridium estertheticum]MBU3202380.1 SMI1/KNR4 family protein [Clostridium estertheticum]MCB2355555.1 SMI1/KNR4 family protein [Clostridium estertheticum]WAG39320.1 SMI1/KNR4 family protein [Clostridium estertheticum]WAG62155.1 SMI1/KNR4 family protein [Clostridium estertheticum]
MKEKILEMIGQYEEENDFYGKLKEYDIEYVEDVLKVKFPESYKWFILNYGSGGICGVEVLGIEKRNDSSVVKITERYRKLGLGSECIVIEDLGEFIICINTSKKNEIIRWDRVNKVNEYRYKNFYEYLIDTFKEAIDNWD